MSLRSLQALLFYLRGGGNGNAYRCLARLFRLGLIIRYGDGNESAILYTQNLGGANSRYFDNILVPNGASVYLVVDSDKKFAEEQYSLTFTYFNYTQ